MKKLFLLTFFFAIALSACGGNEATVPDNTYAKETQQIVEKWIAANQNRDAEALMSLYSTDLSFVECNGATCDVSTYAELDYGVPLDLSRPEYKVEVHSYFVTDVGVYVSIQVTFQDPEYISRNSTPATIILEIHNGLITKETWYYIKI